MARNVIRTLAVVLVLLLAAVGGPFTGSAAAIHNNEQCSKIDALVYEMFSPPGGAHDSDNPCSKAYAVDQAVQNVQQSEQNETKTDLYSAAAATKGNLETTMAVYDNYLNDTQSVAWSKAEVAVAKAYNSGKTKTEAKIAAKSAIEDYYTTKQINLIESWNVTVKSHDSLDRAATDDGVGANYATVAWRKGSSGANVAYVRYQHDNDTTTLTLANGTTHGVRQVYIKYHNGAPETQYGHADPTTGKVALGNAGNQGIAYALKVKDSSGGSDHLVYANFSKFKTRWNRIETKTANLKTELDTFVNNTWGEMGGKINASTFVSRQTAMFEYGTDASASGSRNLFNSVAALSMTGADTPQLNGTGTMQVSTSQGTYHGLVLADEAPNGSWTANTTYNASNIGGPVWLASTDGHLRSLDGEFTIGTISNESGGNIQSVKASKVDYKTANTSQMVAVMEEMRLLREEIESRQASGGIGGGSGNSRSLLLVALAALALAGVANRGGGGGRRGR